MCIKKKKNTRGFGGRKQLKPILHYGRQGVHTDFGGARHQPPDHFSPSPVQRSERDAHNLRNGRNRTRLV